MKRLARIPGLPLLVKELVEQAARRRTYIVRVVYAALLFFAFGVYFYGEVAGYIGSYRLLGVGRSMFEFLLNIQFAGIYVFLPAMVSGAITYEKERRQLELLFITDLTPWEIVLQKLGGRLLPMFTFLLLSLPLMAVCYTLGGVTSGGLALAAGVLFTTCVQVGAFALMISAYCRTSTTALLATYVCGAGVAVAVTIAWGVLLVASFFLSPFGLIGVAPLAVPLGLLPLAVLDMSSAERPVAILTAVAAWGWTGFFLYRARTYLVSRAFLQGKDRKFGLFGALGPAAAGAFAKAGRWEGFGGTASLPDDEPITWREVSRSALGGPYWFVRMSMLFALPVLFFGLLSAAMSRRGGTTCPVSWLVYLLWFLAALAVSAPGAGSVVVERTKRTLDLLLTTPLAGREIIRQKSAPTRRLVALLMAPFVTLSVIAAVWRAGDVRRAASGGRDLGPLGYLVIAVISVPVFLAAFGWVARWISLRAPNRARAALVTLGVLVGWAAGPFMVTGAVASLMRTQTGPGGIAWLYITSPAMMIRLVERSGTGESFRELFGTGPAAPIVASFALHAAIALVFRALCLWNADRYLGRAVPEGGHWFKRDAGSPLAEEVSAASAAGAKP